MNRKTTVSRGIYRYNFGIYATSNGGKDGPIAKKDEFSDGPFREL